MFPHEIHFLALIFRPPILVFLTNQPASSDLNCKGRSPRTSPHVNSSPPHNGQELRAAEPASSASLLISYSQGDCVLLSLSTNRRTAAGRSPPQPLHHRTELIQRRLHVVNDLLDQPLHYRISPRHWLCCIFGHRLMACPASLSSSFGNKWSSQSRFVSLS